MLNKLLSWIGHGHLDLRLLVLISSVCWYLLLFGSDFGFAQQPVSKPVSFLSPVIALASDSESQSIYAASGNVIFKFDLELNCIARQISKMDYVHDLALTQDQLIVAGGNPGVDGGVEVYSRGVLTLTDRRDMHFDSIQALAVNENVLLTASTDNHCQRIELNRLETFVEFKEHSKPVTCLTLIPDSELVVSAGLDDTIRVWGIESGTLKHTLTHHQDDVLDIDSQKTDPDSLPTLVSVSKDRTVRFWQPTIGRMLRFQTLQQTPTVCVWVQGTKRVVVATDAGRVIEIDSETLKVRELADLKKPIISLAIISNQQLAIGTRDSLDLINY